MITNSGTNASDQTPELAGTLPDDGIGAILKHFDHLRATRYTEIFLIGGNAATRELKANVYNTTGLNDAAKGDSCPQGLVQRLNVKALKDQYHVLGAFVNGPRLWTLDWIDVPAGVVRDFEGLKAAWVGRLELTGMDLERKGATAYKPTTIERKTEFGFLKGKPVFILDDPEGNSWVMKSLGLIVDPGQTFGQLSDLAGRLKPAPGWRFRVQELDRDLILKPESGVAAIVQDELGNTYDRAGEGYGNFRP